MLMLKSSHAGPINIGSPHEVSMRQLAERIRQLTGSQSEIVYIPRPQDDPTVRRADITLARAELGWEPTTSLDDGLLRTIDWFRSTNGR
jgi:dTDP-glucose 4,6-dehydratase